MTLADTGKSSWYWLALAGLGVAMEGIALFYQYRLDYWPCVLCIHVRIWTLALILAALFGLLTRRHRALNLASHALTAGIGIGLLERAWKLLGVERGTLEGSCSMDTGLPAWFALDKWLPSVFEPQTPCGYTPDLPLGITMAEGLVAIGALLSLAAGGLMLAAWQRKRGGDKTY
ncbi:disulfide bond formation protein B [Thiohalobacter sp. IOR34]|uniref:disulfide bond formation protein B n=1 Tax=Thiohalobacter sp. IOR34 TaxID=3057176 RepID=UPI0025B17596|nr:disulfide bond formation protein B [Thiohalobacter sp. IOR34]WJW76547.1 disulfide bond formation protein B [Thiohalobacter sp. IOR34]